MSYSNEELRSKVQEALDGIRPFLQADGGDVQLIDIDANMKVRLKLMGACKSCEISHMTMKAGIEESIRRFLPEVGEVVAVD